MQEPDLPLTVVTHGGKHHADEALAVFFVRERFDAVRVYRTECPVAVAHADILLDCGGVYDSSSAKFDHHGRPLEMSPARPSGYATSGLVWRAYGKDIVAARLQQLSSPEWRLYAQENDAETLEETAQLIWKRLDREIVLPLDAWDNGHYPAPEATRQWLPVQWLIQHMEFEDVVSSLGRAFIHRLRTLADGHSGEWLLGRDLLRNGATSFYLFNDRVLVVAPPQRRIEVAAARRAVRGLLGLPLLGVISPLRHNTRWAALLAEPIPEAVALPDDVEFTSGRRCLYHADSEVLLAIIKKSFSGDG